MRPLTAMAIIVGAFSTVGGQLATGSPQLRNHGLAVPGGHPAAGLGERRSTAQRGEPGPTSPLPKRGTAGLPVGGQYHCIFTKGADLSWRASRFTPSLTNESVAFRILVQKETLVLALDEESDFKDGQQSLPLLPRLVTPMGTSLYAILPTGTGMLVLHQGLDGRVIVSQWNSYFMPMSDTVYQGASVGTCSRTR
jgi:hypothetical protein